MGMVVQVPVPDSLVTSEGETSLRDAHITSFSLAGGGGVHFREIWLPLGLPLGYTDCEPGTPLDIKSEFKELGVVVDHGFDRRIHAGIRGGYVWETNTLVSGYDTTLTDVSRDRDFVHVDPYVAVDWKWVGLGVGGVFASKKLPDGGPEDYPVNDDGDAQFSGHLRVGPLTSVYGNLSFWEGVPLLTSGHATLGIGARPIRPLELYAGYTGDGPYQNDQWLGRITVDANPNWSFYLNMRFPRDWNGLGDEYGTSMGAAHRVLR
jgi:hypothetical protein